MFAVCLAGAAHRLHCAVIKVSVVSSVLYYSLPNNEQSKMMYI